MSTLEHDAPHPQRIITAQDIIAARQRVAAAGRDQQLDFEDALLASPDLEPDMVREWCNARVRVDWCACEKGDHARIVCAECGLPPYWKRKEEIL
jgi:hypothetical protein